MARGGARRSGRAAAARERPPRARAMRRHVHSQTRMRVCWPAVHSRADHAQQQEESTRQPGGPAHLHELQGAAREALLRGRQRLGLVAPHHPAVHVLAGGARVAARLGRLVCRGGQARSEQRQRWAAQPGAGVGCGGARHGGPAAQRSPTNSMHPTRLKTAHPPGPRSRRGCGGAAHPPETRSSKPHSCTNPRTLQLHVKGWDAVAPPQLPRHAPVPDVLHPAAGGAGRAEGGCSGAGGWAGGQGRSRRVGGARGSAALSSAALRCVAWSGPTARAEALTRTRSSQTRAG